MHVALEASLVGSGIVSLKPSCALGGGRRSPSSEDTRRISSGRSFHGG